MIEVLFLFFISLIGFVLGYGVLREQVRSNKITSDERHHFYLSEISELRKNNGELKTTMQKILIQLERVSSHIEFIKEKIED